MSATPSALGIVPVLPSADIERDLKWYDKQAGFTSVFSDKWYAGLRRENLWIHLQFHHGTEDDPLLGGSVIRIFVTDIQPYLEEFVARGTVVRDKLRMHTPWGTHEFGFFDLNNNAIFVVQDA